VHTSTVHPSFTGPCLLVAAGMDNPCKIPTSPKARQPNVDYHPVVKSLSLLDPLLQFLTKRSGKTSVPLSILKSVVPGGIESPRHQGLLEHISELNYLRILRLQGSKKEEIPTTISWDSSLEIGFPAPPALGDAQGAESVQAPKQAGSLHGSTKAAAKRRLAALKKILKAEAGTKLGIQSKVRSTASQGARDATTAVDSDTDNATAGNILKKEWDFQPHEATGEVADDLEEELCYEAKTALESLTKMFHFKPRPKKGQHTEGSTKNAIPEYILGKQASYAGSHAAQTSKYGELDIGSREKIPSVVLAAFGLGGGSSDGQRSCIQRKLYTHQAKAINSAVQDCHTLVCTSTGSGKSLVRFEAWP
jgi:hypothetical protein